MSGYGWIMSILLVAIHSRNLHNGHARKDFVLVASEKERLI